MEITDKREFIMSKNTIRSMIGSGSLVLVFLTVLQAAAFADSIEGRVARVSSQALDVTVYDAQGRPYPNALHLKVDNRTELRGITSILDLRPNEAVGAEVRQEEAGVWCADSVTLFQEINAHPATRNPSPSLRDVLGNPVVRGALMGAATGAIASSASGGKAGKGALIGAGVGAAGGLLESLFSQNSQSQGSSTTTSSQEDSRR